MAIRTDTSLITLNVNGLNALTKDRLAEGVQKQGPYICCLQEMHIISRDTYKLKVRGWKKILHANMNQKNAGVAIFISDKTDLKEHYKRQRRTLHNDQRIISRRRYNNCKYICMQHRITSIYKATANNIKRRN
uniref:exodeoxyribonuclease III n=1 Tax=Sus scrofa TaxID=9823 RepID=A0A8W4FG58_PIG